jgi:tRNA G18 (ribose-2'-O)-methylase SpoU
MQTNHYNSSFQKQNFPIVLVCDNVSKAPNIGSLFRTADAFGIESLMLCGEHISLGRRMTKTSRATEKFVDYEIHRNTLELVKDLKTRNYLIIALEITSNSILIQDLKFSKNQKVALIIGDENLGIPDSILNVSDIICHINMYGQNSSMNVVQAASIALYQLTGIYMEK